MSSRIESGFVPLPKVEREQPENNIKISLNLPGYVDQDRIGVNLTEIARLCRLVGIRELVVLGKTDEETSRTLPEIAGVNLDGSAMASKKITKAITTPIFETNSRSYDNRKWPLIANRWIDLNIGINVEEIGLRISRQPEGIRAVKNWAKELNNGLKIPIKNVGNQNLLHNLEIGDKFELGSIVVIVGTSLGLELALGILSPILTDMLLISAPVAGKLGSLLRKRMGLDPDPNHRFSIFLGPQIDRAIILNIESATTTLIKDIHQDKK
jgi:hypothetical protein